MKAAYAETIASGHPDLAPGPALEAQYLQRAAVPTWEQHMAEWEVIAQEIKRNYEIRRDLPYGPTAAEKLDIILPAQRSSNMPVVFLIHGGYWRALDKDSILCVASGPAQNGIITVNLDYALCPSVTFSELVAQCFTALRWVKANIAQYGGDPDNIHCAGHSAGAHLSTLLALSPEFSASIRSVCAVSGVYDLAPVACASMQADLRLTEEEVQTLSPLRLPPPRSGNWIFAVGTAETPSFIWQTEHYAETCSSSGLNCRRVPIAGANHYTAITALGQDGTALQTTWLNQIKETS